MKLFSRGVYAARCLGKSRTLINQRAQSNITPKFEALNTHYSLATKCMHWTMGSAVLGCFAFVQISYYRPKEEKGYWMWLHKSCGLIVAGLLLPRIFLRLASKVPPHVPGPWVLQKAADA